MGKRSTNTTKSGKYMNPTDQARKEARKRELKKNKKQRQAVRAAVLKGKNPREIVAELEKIDDMEFNALSPPPLNDKVLRDKRRKLHETWTRVMKMYEKEDVEQYVELKRLWHSYQARKHEVVQHFEAVRNAQNVQVDEIPLPSMEGGGAPDGAPAGEDLADSLSIPLPPMMMPPKGSILKKPSVLDALKPKTCPGVPSGPPPALEDYLVGIEKPAAGDEDKSDGVTAGDDADPVAAAGRTKKIRFDDEAPPGTTALPMPSKAPGGNEEGLVAPGEESGPQVDEIQRRMLQMAGQDVDQYMKEMEEVHRQTQADRAADLQHRLSRLDQQQTHPPQDTHEPVLPPPMSLMPPSGIRQVPPNQAPAIVPPGPPLMAPPMRHPIMYRPAPPPLRPGMAPPGVRPPPGPPPGRPNMPPGPPPGRPPVPQAVQLQRGVVPPLHAVLPLPPRPTGVVSAGPQLNKEATAPATSAATMSTKSASGVIEGKPQMRNLKSDITRFVPTHVKVRRAGDGAHAGAAAARRKQVDPMQEVFQRPEAVAPTAAATAAQPKAASKDDAYAQFMQEMDQLLK